MKTIKINTENLTESAAPLHYQFDGQYQAQHAYIEIDPREDEIEVSADYSGETGGGGSARHYHHLVETIPVPSCILGSALIEHMTSDAFKKDILELCEGYEEVYNGNNFIGRWQEGTCDELRQMEYAMYNIETAEVSDGESWIDGDVYYKNEDGSQVDIDDATKAFYGNGKDAIEIKTENLEALVKSAKGYVDESTQLIIGIEEAFESIIEDLED